MRAVAVLLVMLNHAGIRGLGGGYVGVDVFFVISGYLITGILVREVRQTARISIATFYARRARRILPAATVVLLVVIALSGVVFTSARRHDVLTHVTWAAFFAANIFSSRAGSDYFAQDTFVSPVLHFWSLAVEEQFYLVWPPLIALILFSTHRRRRAGGTAGRVPGAQVPGAGMSGARASSARVPSAPAGQAPSARKAALALRRLTTSIAVLCGLSLAWSVWQTGAAPTKAYYSTLTRGWELGAGALLALGAGWVAGRPRGGKLVASWAGLGMIGWAAVTYSAATPFPGFHAMLPVLGAVLVLGGGIEGPTHGARLVLDTRPLRWFGDISYSLYLWHWPFLAMPELYLARRLTIVERIALMGAAIVAARWSYRYIETPCRRSPVLSRRHVRSLALWPAASATVVAAVFFVGAVADVGKAPGAVAGVRTAEGGPGAALALAAEMARSNHALPDELRPRLQDLQDDVSRLPAGCPGERNTVAVTTCVLGDPKAKRTIVLFGDSHVIMWLRPVERLAKARGWRLVAVEKASCFPVDATLWRSDLQRPYTECDRWRAKAYDVIAKLKPDRILVSGLLSLILTDPATGAPASGATGRRLFDDGVRNALAMLRRATSEVYVIGGTPYLVKSAGDCLGTRKATMATCVRPPLGIVLQRNADWRQAARVTGAHFIDTVPWLCSHDRCPLVVGNVIVYWDNNHVTRTFADTLEKTLASTLKL